jgi:uncharacterized protein (TIGR02284 family)
MPDSVEATIEALISRLQDTADFYRTAARNARHEKLRELFEARAEERTRFVNELAPAAWQAGENVATEEPGAVGEALHRGLTTLRAAMTLEQEQADNTLLGDSQGMEKELLTAYGLALGVGLPPPARRVLERHYREIEAAYSAVNATLTRLGHEVIVAMFPDMAAARQAVESLQAVGFSSEQIGLLANETVLEQTVGQDDKQTTREGAAAGALGGSVVGGIVGLAAAIGTLVGFPVVLAGSVLTAIGAAVLGVGAGASIGSIFGALLGWGVSEEDTRHYVEGLRRGEVLVAVHARPEEVGRSMATLRAAGGFGISERFDRFDELFDGASPAPSPDQ